ncbi:MAG: phenylalanyl-tRNA synthetase alpha chain [Solirubrobacterales bacterium]|jgi:phenylalanyl-tRNA synthetase alpha chain|nr:phenylalanyl-tRNA synthetase alpha chain [Solirubrobacterales bacterium]
MLDKIDNLRGDASSAIEAAADADALEALRVRFLGRKSELTGILRGIAELEPSERGPVGAAANAAREALESELEARREELEATEIEAALGDQAIDVTLPGAPPVAAGHLHLLTRTRREIEDIFVGLGYRVMEGPEVEHDFYNFTALNHPPGHPARQVQDSFYADPETLPEGVLNERGLPPGPREVLLRTHTSPMQVRAMEAQEPPIFIIVPGTVYRRDTIDATHSPMFRQVEGLAVAEGISLTDLAGTLEHAAKALFGPQRRTRLKPDYFPFTEPSVQVDVSCFACDGTGTLPGGGRDPLCKGTGWIEILGAGMVDPNVYGFVGGEYDPETTQGFAFGMGIERIAMLKHGIPDLRLFFENDVRFLRQFA